MKNFYLTAAVIVTTSLASNLLWVRAFGTAVPGFRGTLRSAAGDLLCELRDLVDAWVAGLMVRSVRQPPRFRLDGPSARGRKHIELQRGHFGYGGQLSRCRARTAVGARSR
jgi:hypothetical protein